MAGFVAASYTHGAFAILGLSVILMQSATAFAIVQYLGAAYLFWIGIRALWVAYRGGTCGFARKDLDQNARARICGGIFDQRAQPQDVDVLPRCISSVISIGETTVMASFSLVVMHSVINAVWFRAMVLLFPTLTAVARSGPFQQWLKGVIGVVFIGFGVKLAAYRPNL